MQKRPSGRMASETWAWSRLVLFRVPPPCCLESSARRERPCSLLKIQANLRSGLLQLDKWRQTSTCLSLTRLPVGAFIGNAMQNTENARRFVHLARTSTISSLNPNESSPGRAGKALEKRETERVSGSGWRAAHTRRAGGRVSQSRKGLRS